MTYHKALLAGILLTVCACSDTTDSPEQGIRNWLDESEAALEDGDWRALAEHIASHYEDGRGNDKDRLAGQLRAALLRQGGTIEIVTIVDEIELFGDDAASVVLTARFVSIDKRLTGAEAGSYRVKLDLAAVGDDWQVYSARWGSSERDWR
ncbi:MAG: hypothetical protein AAGH76_14730 [Pseudomonadota bacterium]